MMALQVASAFKLTGCGKHFFQKLKPPVLFPYAPQFSQLSAHNRKPDNRSLMV